jgi:hypothetical protein
MAFSTWFKPDGVLQDLSAEDLRREEHRLKIREEQLVARLQQVITDREAAFTRGAEDRSVSLRRILARRFAACTAEQSTLERDLLRLGKEMWTVRSFLALTEAGKRPKGVGDAVAELQVSYEDDRVGESPYRDLLRKSLGLPAIESDTVAEVFRVWRALDKGEFPNAAEARRAIAEDGGKADGKS